MSKNMTYADRLKIEMYLNDGKTQREIARLMNRHYNTINYEIKCVTVKRGLNMTITAQRSDSRNMIIMQKIKGVN